MSARHEDASASEATSMRGLASPRLVWLLIVALMAASAVVALAGAGAGWPVAAAAVLMAFSLVACLVARLRRRSPYEHEPPPPGVDEFPISGETWPDDEAYMEAAAHVLDVRGWHGIQRVHDGVEAVRGAIGSWGAFLLHLGVLVTIIGALASAAFSFEGTLFLVEGQEVFDGEPAYERIERQSLVGSSYSGATLRLDAATLVPAESSPMLVSEVSAAPSGSDAVVREVSAGDPLEIEGSTFILEEAGHAAVLLVRPEAGGAGVVTARLAESEEGVWTETATYAAEGDVYGIELEGELAAPGANGASRSSGPVRVRLTRADREIGETMLAPGELMETDEVTVTFQRLSVWNRLTVRRDPGRWVLYGGILLVVAGAVWRFAVRDVRLRLRVRTSESGRVARVTTASEPWRDAGGWSVGETTEALRRLAARGIEDAVG